MKSIAIFCGSALGNNPAYLQVAEKVGRHLAGTRHSHWSYGGGRSGLMVLWHIVL